MSSLGACLIAAFATHLIPCQLQSCHQEDSRAAIKKIAGLPSRRQQGVGFANLQIFQDFTGRKVFEQRIVHASQSTLDEVGPISAFGPIFLCP